MWEDGLQVLKLLLVLPASLRDETGEKKKQGHGICYLKISPVQAGTSGQM